MRAIYKYGIGLEHTLVAMPVGARVISAGLQDSGIVVWAIVDEHAPKEYRQFTVLGTGWGVADNIDKWTFVGTIQAPNGLVWHVFDSTSTTKANAA